MSFTFFTNKPAAANNPSDDQPDMLTNNVTADAAWNVDHIPFNNTNCGKHKQVTFITKNVAGAQTDPASTMYTDDGSASSNAQAYFRNEDHAYLINPVRAFCTFNTSASVTSPNPLTINNGYNVNTVVATASGATVTVTLDTNVVTGDNVLVYISNELGSTFTYTFTNPNLVITGLTNQQRNNRKTDVLIIQA